MKLSEAQKAAVNEQRNTVVLAGAGSGKTRVLAQRYLRLVLQDRIPVRSILTLTFTRKAAAEMYERIYSDLANHAEDEFIRRELEHFDEATISTLDSFCSEVAAAAAPQFGLPPSFTVDPTAVTQLAEELGLRFVREYSAHPGLQRLIAELGLNATLSGCLVPLSVQMMSPARPTEFGAIHAMQTARLKQDLDEGRGTVRQLLDAVAAIPGPAPPSLTKLIDAAERLRADAAWSTPELELDLAELQRANAELAVFRGLSGRQTTLAAATYKELQPEIKKTSLRLQEGILTVALEPRLRELFELFSELQVRVLEQKRARAVLSYHDVVLLAVEALRTSPELRSYYKTRFRALLIDEFQDNDPLQKELLYLLAERDELLSTTAPEADQLEAEKLFFVGDDKQSIYRFRGADVAVFRSLAYELQQAGGKILELAANYRSEPALVEFCNGIFPAVMAPVGPTAKPWEAVFRPLEHRAATPGLSPEIAVFAYDAEAQSVEDSEPEHEEPAAPDDAEAYFVARTISEGVRTARWIVAEEDGSTRPAEYSDIAVLMRSGSNQIKYERLLRRFGVPYNAGDVRSLFLEAPSYDIYHLLRLVLYPEESLSYAAVLRGPLVALSDEGMVRELLQFSGTAFGENTHGGADGRRFEQGAAMYQALRDKADRQPVTELLEDIWYRYGYRYYLVADSEFHPYLEYYDYLFALAAQDPTITLWEYLAVIRENLGDYKKFEDASILREEESGVQLLTIHRSKGLQFPIVFLVNTGNKGRNADGGSACYISEEFGPCLRLRAGERLHDQGATNYFYQRAKDEESAKDTAELKRLLYVALTRAQHHLIVSGVLNKRGANAENCHMLMLRDAGVPLAPIPSVTAGELQRAGSGALSTSWSIAVDQLPEPDQVLRRPALRHGFAATELNAVIRATETAPLPDEQHLDELDQLLRLHGLEAAYGTYVHALLQQALPAEPGAVPQVQIEQLRSSLFSALSDSEFGTVRLGAETARMAFLRSELGDRALAATEREVELGFVYRPRPPYETTLLSGSIDLLCSHDGSRFLVDYKTDLLEKPEVYAVQLQIYREAVCELYGEEPEVYLFYLRTARAVRVEPRPDLLQEALKTALH